ncbi:thioredoxin-like protein [Tribonema minus]|uniref:Thioredoxin-like protein n=1 Tax=Tribonema minus TaxID=303371 RepID=A0A835YJ66_9STRA|nr:thioredoxin-like protein [Tribonema minus]
MAEIMAFVKNRYGVTFPVFNKLEVNGADEHPLFTFLKSAPGTGDSTDVQWNFTKWLCKDGIPIKRYSFKHDPSLIEADILEALK